MPAWVSSLNLNWAASLICGLMALSFFAIHVISSPTKKHWMRLPNWVRTPIFIAGAVLVYRSADLLSLAIDFPDGTGHVTPVGLLGLLGGLAGVGSLACHALSQAYNPRIWNTLNRMHTLAGCPPRPVHEKGLAMVDGAITLAAVNELESVGAIVAGPGEDLRGAAL